MSISTLLLYGSRARGDEILTSDVDLLAITDEKTYKTIVHGSINTVCYPRELAIERALSGDLFILHIVKEAKILYDQYDIFNEIKLNFTYKENYKKEISDAVDLGWMLTNAEFNILNYTLLNRRIAWCVRTILIAKTAEKRNPLFSLKDLINFSNLPETELLIENKNNDSYEPWLINTFRDFLKHMNFKEEKYLKKFSPLDYQIYFQSRKNGMALKTLKMITSTFKEDGY